jgi:hypothetical protein
MGCSYQLLCTGKLGVKNLSHSKPQTTKGKEGKVIGQKLAFL